ncbi:TetR/AcrR family transcriptional regulator [Thermococcus gorgonarius]|uniref:TetR family transcriptional regulator n=1 Tax=Thermococcus gorgonarius TaxID=71997 RepID=A0A2Z2MBX1_THEGO|nr:TetR/AcrR family transcriptional regulator [Thermococcus gorgonarius]ASJ01434.1 TetR family transcriptional regulator [Thermococcus gorgonarius]
MSTKSPGKTREKLVSAAMELFAKKGFDKTTVDEIVAKAGVAKGTFYLYFKSKDDLIKELAFEVMPIMAMPSLNDPYITLSYPTLESYLLQLGKEFLDFYSENYRADIFFHMLSVRRRMKSLNEIYSQSCSELLREGARRITAYVKVGFEDALIAFQMFLASLMHYLHAGDCLGFSREHYLKKVISAVIHHLKLSASV